MAQTSSSPPVASVSVHALSCGHFTLPEHQFVKPSSLDARRTVPSLAFLIQHVDNNTSKRTNILFDLGLRGDLDAYPAPVQKHIEGRRPIESRPDVVENLAKGGLKPEDIDYVVLSHVHWDHIGTPSRFSTSTFIVGPGSLDLLSGKTPPANGTHSFFESGLLPLDRTTELSNPLVQSEPESQAVESPSTAISGSIDARAPWLPHSILPHTLDLFGDGSLLIVNAPGHLQGHINILARIFSEPDRYMYLAGDACHDRRLLTGEKEIGEWMDAGGRGCCIHVDKEEAEGTIERIRMLEKDGVEVVFAHDGEWETENGGRFWGV